MIVLLVYNQIVPQEAPLFLNSGVHSHLIFGGTVSITLTNWVETHLRRYLEGVIVTTVKEADLCFILYGKILMELTVGWQLLTKSSGCQSDSVII
jgi:hypothetical protein